MQGNQKNWRWRLLTDKLLTGGLLTGGLLTSWLLLLGANLGANHHMTAIAQEAVPNAPQPATEAIEPARPAVIQPASENTVDQATTLLSLMVGALVLLLGSASPCCGPCESL